MLGVDKHVHVYPRAMSDGPSKERSSRGAFYMRTGVKVRVHVCHQLLPARTAHTSAIVVCPLPPPSLPRGLVYVWLRAHVVFLSFGMRMHATVYLMCTSRFAGSNFCAALRGNKERSAAAAGINTRHVPRCCLGGGLPWIQLPSHHSRVCSSWFCYFNAFRGCAATDRHQRTSR